LGGSKLQNFYHDLWEYPRIDLPYLEKTKVGIIFQTGILYNFIKKSQFKMSGKMEGNYVTSASASKLFSDFHFEYETILSFQLCVGYVYYYYTDKWLSSIFDNGFTWKLLASKEFNELCGLDFWFTKGRYGIEDEFHFGLTCRFYFKE